MLIKGKGFATSSRVIIDKTEESDVKVCLSCDIEFERGGIFNSIYCDECRGRMFAGRRGIPNYSNQSTQEMVKYHYDPVTGEKLNRKYIFENGNVKKFF
jgi:hypothetical protein